MKIIFTTFCFMCLCICHTGMAQEDYPYFKENWNDDDPEDREISAPKETDEAGDLKATVNVALGVINPEEINNYIRNDLSNQGIYLIDGSSDMAVAFIVGAHLYYVFTPKFQAKAILDYALGLSSTELVGQVSQSEYITYTASRISIGAGANYYFGQNKINPYAGAAVLFHAVKFEGYKGTAVTPRLEGGVAFNFSQRFKMEAFLQLDTAEAEAKKLSKTMTIDFSSVNAGARFLFKI